MTWRPELVALDVDGTIVDRDGKLPDPVRDAVADLVKHDISVVLATGRSWHGTEPVLTALALPPGPVVCSNGAVVLNHPPTEIIRTVTFDAREVVAQVLARRPDTLVAVEEVGRGYRVSNLFPDGDLTGEMIVTDVEQIVAEPVTRVILRDPTSTDQEFLELAESLGLRGCTYFIGWSAWLDIVPEGVSKAAALADVAARQGIDPGDVLALGDGRNDLEMLRWAGRGVALGDAPDEVKDAADHVTGRFDDGGTVEELRRWV